MPSEWTTPVLDVQTDGDEIVWSKGGDSVHGAPDLYSYTPGASSPVLVYKGAVRDAQLMPIAVKQHRYAFEETLGGDEGYWKLYYVASVGEPALLLDSSANDPTDLAAPATWLAMTDDGLVWNCVHAGPSGPRSFLRRYEFATGTTQTLLEADAAATEYMFPNADARGRLAFATIENLDAAGGPTFHVYLAGLSDAKLQPKQLDRDGEATQPVLSGDTVVWRSVYLNEVGNAGQLTRYSVSTGGSRQMLVSGQTGESFQTAGNRYVAFWSENHTVFDLYDLQTDTSLMIEQHDPTAAEGVVRPAVAGDLVVFLRILDDTNSNLQVCWLRLPPLD